MPEHKPKKPWLSKTLWVNVVAILALILQSYVGLELTAETQVSILAVVNVVLRLATSEPLDWSAGH